MFDNAWIEIENESWQLIATSKKDAKKDGDRIQQKTIKYIQMVSVLI